MQMFSYNGFMMNKTLVKIITFILLIINFILCIPFLLTHLNITGLKSINPFVYYSLPLVLTKLLFNTFANDLTLPKVIKYIPLLCLALFFIPYDNHIINQWLHSFGLTFLFVIIEYYLIRFDHKKRLALMIVLPLATLLISLSNNINLASQWVIIFLIVYQTF